MLSPIKSGEQSAKSVIEILRNGEGRKPMQLARRLGMT
ncbi:hypothetical protein FHX08_006329 [Rhizobium sp. BK529]|nr:hypothetical protein [Rhizobium sp. BK529]